MYNNDYTYEEFYSDSIEEIVRERNKNKALRKMFPLTFGNGKDNTRYYLMNNFDDGSSKKELLNDDFFKILEQKYTGNTLPESNNVSEQTPTEIGFVGKIKTAARSVVETAKKITGSRYVKEGLFALEHPVKALMTGPYIDKAPNISTTVSRFANAGEILECNVINDKLTDEASEKGAMRHALWQATLSSIWNDNIARRIGNAHEDGLDYDVSVRRYNNLIDADRTVDLLNNIEGRRIARTYKTYNPKKMALCVLEEFRKNGLYIAVQGADGHWHIERRKLDDEKYNRMLQEYQKMNFLGY